MKDRFSDQSNDYKQFRPDYPEELYAFILKKIAGRNLAWDVGTGNGQAAVALAKHFKQVLATDISTHQLALAQQAENIQYEKATAHKSGIQDNTVDLVVVAQALHWFANEAFFQEVSRVAKPGALFAAWGYGLLHINADIDEVVQDFYHNVIGPYWDPERKHIENQYQSISFPFAEFPDIPAFAIKRKLSLEAFCGYVGSWSAVQRYTQISGQSPIPDLQARLDPLWQEKLRRWNGLYFYGWLK